MKPPRTSALLINEDPLQVLPSLAKEIGLNEAIFIQQIHFWVSRGWGKEVPGQDGLWIYNTHQEWIGQFPFWSESTLKRIITSAKDKGILRTGSFNKVATDRTTWYSIDYDELSKLDLTLAQNALSISSKWTNGKGQSEPLTLAQNDPLLPENRILTEITTENTTSSATADGDKNKASSSTVKASRKEPTEEGRAAKAILARYAELLEHPIAHPGKEAGAATRIVKQGYTVEEMEGCYKAMKAEGFWAKKTISLTHIHERLGTWKKQSGGAAPRLRLTEEERQEQLRQIREMNPEVYQQELP